MEIDLERLREALKFREEGFTPWNDEKELFVKAAQYLLDNADLMLVKLPEPWRLGSVFDQGNGNYAAHYRDNTCSAGIKTVFGTGPTPRQASMAALAKIGETNEG